MTTLLYTHPVLINVDEMQATYPGPDGVVVMFRSGRDIVLPEHTSRLFGEAKVMEFTGKSVDMHDAGVWLSIDAIEHLEIKPNGIAIQLTGGKALSVRGESIESLFRALNVRHPDDEKGEAE